MGEIKRTPPELEASGPYVIAIRHLSDDEAQSTLVADCSTSPHGEVYARLFARSLQLHRVAKDLLHLATHNDVPEEQQIEIAERAIEIIAAIEGHAKETEA